MKTILFGDCHGAYTRLTTLLRVFPDACFVQVGDFGVGAAHTPPLPPKRVRFIRGNHDNPDLCQRHPNYLGDFGSHGEWFWAGGAYSHGAQFRVPGVNWWAGEELSHNAMEAALALYEQARPRYVITHDSPTAANLSLPSYKPNRTRLFLDALYARHRPELWVFGHHHQSLRWGCFVGLDIAEPYVVASPPPWELDP